MNKKILIQLFLFSLFLFLIAFSYYKFFKEDPKILKKIESEKDSPTKKIESNLISDLKYFSIDDKGNKYIEGLAGLWCTSLGFSNKKLVKAAYNQLNKLPYYHSFTGKVPKISLELSNKLKKITPIDALSMFGCFRLSAIIYTLRQEGLPIETNFKTKNGKTFAEYELTYDKTV